MRLCWWSTRRTCSIGPAIRISHPTATNGQTMRCASGRSPGWARQIQTRADGFGLDGLIRERADALSGIVNGIDVTVWNPATDPRLPTRYDFNSIETRRGNKLELQRRFGLSENPDRLMLA